MRKHTADILFSSNIPFSLGNSQIWGCDCIGLIIMQLRMDGENVSWEAEIPRKSLSFQEYDYFLRKFGYEQNKEGYIAVLRYIGSAHIGLTRNGQFASQSNQMGGTYVQYLPNNAVRYCKKIN